MQTDYPRSICDRVLCAKLMAVLNNQVLDVLSLHIYIPLALIVQAQIYCTGNLQKLSYHLQTKQVLSAICQDIQCCGFSE